MLCQACQKNPATVHLTHIINYEQSVQHLCEQCAREKGEFDFGASPPFSIQNLLTGLMNMEAPLKEQLVYQDKLQCEGCGLTYAQFGQIGRFGCSECYTVFSNRLLPLMRRIHGSAQHVGKIPARAGGVVRLRRSIDELRRQLKELVSREEFEEAAVIRDKIRSLEEGGEKGDA